MKIAFQHTKSILLAALLAAMPVNAYAQENPATDENQEADSQSWTKEDLVQAYQAENWNESIRIADALLKSEPENKDYLSILGVALAQTSQNERAEKVFMDLSKNNPEDPLIHANLCIVQTALKGNTAEESCLKAAGLNPDNAIVQKTTAQVLESNKKTAEARKYYYNAWKLKKDDLVSLTAATSIDFKNKDYQAAYDLTKEGLDAGNEVSVLYLNSLLALSKLGRYEENIDLADKGYAKFHEDTMLAHKADSLVRLGRLEEAKTLFSELEERTASESMNWPRIELTYAQALLASGCSLEKANTCQTENEDPCCKGERDALEKVTGVQGHKLLKNEPRLPVTLAMAQIVNGELKSAESTLTQALGKTEDKTELKAALAVTLYMFGDKRDQDAGMKYLDEVLAEDQLFAHKDDVQKKYQWAPRMLENLQFMLDKRVEDSQPKTTKSGCSCDVSGSGQPVSLASVLAFLLTLLAGLGWRRKSLRG